jgi:hypothetical protein
MPLYRVKGIDIDHDGVLYPEGETIELDGKQAKRLRGFLEPIQEKVGKSDKKKDTPGDTPNGEGDEQ